MPSLGFEIDSTDIKNLAKVLRRVSPTLGREMRRGVREAARPVMTDMRSEVGGNAMTAWGGGPHAYDGPSGAGGITGKMQRSLSLRISGGRVRIQVRPAALGSAAKVPAYIDAGTSWRHPVYGNRRAHVSQRGSAVGWFTGTAHRHYPQVRADVQDALDAAARKLVAML